MAGAGKRNEAAERSRNWAEEREPKRGGREKWSWSRALSHRRGAEM